MTVIEFPASRLAGSPFDIPKDYQRLFAADRVPRVVLPTGAEAHLIGRYHDVRAVLTGPVSADGTKPGFPMVRGGGVSSSKALSFFRMDGAEHRRYRRLVTGDFTVLRTRTLSVQVREIVEEMVAALAGRPDPFDLVAELALPLPSRVICRILGVPYADADHFHQLSDILTRGPQQGRDQFVAAIGELQAYLGRLAVAKRKEPGEDLMTALIAGFDRDEGLDPGQLSAIVLLLLVAGHETTASMISLVALALMRDAQLRQTLRAEPELIPNAVEELLRYISIAQWVPRTATRDFEVGGRLIRAGEGLIMVPAMANRDPEVFPDPDRLDPRRANADRHLAFGFGPHMCLGAQLARAELRIVVRALVNDLPELRLAVPADQLRFRQLSAFYGMESLPVHAS